MTLTFSKYFVQCPAPALGLLMPRSSTPAGAAWAASPRHPCQPLAQHRWEKGPPGHRQRPPSPCPRRLVPQPPVYPRPSSCKRWCASADETSTAAAAAVSDAISAWVTVTSSAASHPTTPAVASKAASVAASAAAGPPTMLRREPSRLSGRHPRWRGDVLRCAVQDEACMYVGA